MRRRTQALDAHGGDPVSGAYLASNLRRRARSLGDDASTPLFFGRLDTRDAERWYVGRRHVHDDEGDPVVVDWRADVSRPFYRATRADPMGVTLRRRFGFDPVRPGALTAYEDEHLDDPTEHETRSAILTAEIERPRTGPMRDIVATIQPDQDDIVRADVADTVCVQGAPGTGKTAVGLHRAAFLLYAFRDRLRRSGVLVVGPNRSFLAYVGAVLPALGEVEARHTTVEDLVAHVPVRRADTPDVARLKGDARLAGVLRRAVWSSLRAPAATPEALVVPRGSRRWRVPGHELTEVVEGLTARGVRYGAGRAMLAQRLAHAVLVRMERDGESPDDRVQDAVARSRPVKAAVNALWPAVDPARVVMRLLADPGFLAACADGVLDEEEQALLRWPSAPRGPGSAPWAAADAVLVDEARDLVERTPSLGHVVLDEAQDLSPMQLRAVGRRCSTGSATVLGDLAQGTTPWATSSWAETLHHLGKPAARLEELSRGYRVPAEVVRYANRLLPTIAPTLATPTAERQDPGSLRVVRVAPAGLDDALVRACGDALDHQGSVGVVVADGRVAATAALLAAHGVEPHILGDEEHTETQRLVVVPAPLVKGLEYDRVVLVEPGEIVGSQPRGLRLLYVALTRAVTALTVLHAGALPAALVA